MCGMIAYQATISGANLILPRAIRMADRRGRAACGRGPGYAACRHVRERRLIEHDPIQKCPGIKKPAAGFRRGLSSCDVEHMPVICPTGQILSKALVATQDAHALK